MAGDARAEATVRHRIEFAAFRLVRGVLALLPASLADRVGSALGTLAGSVLRIRRGVVDRNLARAFPDADPSWRSRVARDSYRHLVREAVATFRMGTMTPRDVLERTTVHGEFDAMVEAGTRGDGALIVTGHIGNWEIGGAAAAVRGIPVDAVALVQANLLFDREIVETRGRLGMRVMPRGSAHRLVLRSLREGRVPALVADQNVRRGGVFVDFFGIPASTAKGAALFALRTGAPIFFGVAIRRDGADPHWDVHVERIPVVPTGDLDADVRRVTQTHIAALERWVRRHPEQYFWHHKRWKTRPSASGEEDAAASPVGTDLPRGP